MSRGLFFRWIALHFARSALECGGASHRFEIAWSYYSVEFVNFGFAVVERV
jgi:hypothetical protein